MPTRALVLALAAQVAGIEVGLRLGGADGMRPLGAAVLLTLAAVALRSRWARPLLGAAVVLAAAGCTQRSLAGLAPEGIPAALRSGGDVAVRLTLVEDPVAGRFSARVLARLDAWSEPGGRWRPVGRRVAVGATGPVAARLAFLDAGDRVQGSGRWGVLRPWERHLRWRHAAGHVELTDLLEVSPPGGPVLPVANRLRAAVLDGTRLLPGSARGLVAGLVLGDTRELPDHLVAAFRSAGLGHLLVVSGSNVAFALGLVAPLLSPFGLRLRCVGGLVTVLVFGTMTRWEPSVTRAVAMAVVVLGARASGRPQEPLRVLLLAVGALLALDPLLVRSLGFRLSVAATAGIAGFAAPLHARLATRFRRAGPVVDGIATSMAAQLGVTPLLVASFGGVPLVSVPANLLAAPFVGPLTVCGLLTGAVAGVLDPAAGRMLVAPTAVLAGGLITVARAAARCSVPVGAGPLLAAAAFVAAGALGRRRRRGPTPESARRR